MFVEFKYFTGFAISQKQKSIGSFHSAIRALNIGYNPLEISTKSTELLGQKLSAFNLTYYHNGAYLPIECIFQSSKVFENGSQFTELMFLSPRDAKRDERLRNSGRIVKFKFDDEDWATEPKTMFYDWIYIVALASNSHLVQEVVKYNAFTDIEFNHEKSINCQARSVAIFVSLYKNGKLNECLASKDKFKEIYKKHIQPVQMTLFDI